MKGFLLRIIVEHDAKYRDKPLYEYMASRFIEEGVSGMSVFKAVKGFGKSHKVHSHHFMHPEEPVAIEILESKENIDKILPFVKGIVSELGHGIVTLEELDIVR
ncbi:MAG: DUF190 domain-containing protein [bacterium]